MRHITDEGLRLIQRFEGFSPTIYICPAGWPTIGYGHVVKDRVSSVGVVLAGGLVVLGADRPGLGSGPGD